MLDQLFPCDVSERMRSSRLGHYLETFAILVGREVSARRSPAVRRATAMILTAPFPLEAGLRGIGGAGDPVLGQQVVQA